MTVEDISYDDLRRLSRCFLQSANLHAAQDVRIDDWLKKCMVKFERKETANSDNNED